MAKISINLQTAAVEKEQEEEMIVGIDLGTTHSLVAYVDSDNYPKTVKDACAQSSLVPSIIWFDQDKVYVGEEAKSKMLTNPDATLFSVKRFMGKSYQDVQGWASSLSYKIWAGDTDESLVKIQVANKFYSPVELSALILKELKTRVESHVGRKVRKAVITVPAYFNDAQRQATRDAGKWAGLDVLRIVNEPTAAALAYGFGLKNEDSKTVVVYDLGGGTFDVSILRIEGTVFEVISTHGNTFLGGDDFDRLIMEYWIDLYQMQNLNAVALQKLRLMAEQAKKAMTSEDFFEEVFMGKSFQLDASTWISLSKKLVDQTIDSCKKALRDAELEIHNIDDVVLVGGSSRMPVVKQALHNFFGRKPNDQLNPDEVVALGAAIQADVLSGRNKETLLLDVTPLSLGIETVGGLMDVIIPRNSKIPNQSGRQYTTSIDGQVNLKVSVFQGERDLVKDNRKLGSFTLKGIPPMPAGLPKIEIHFILDADGILKVRAKELRSGVEQIVEVNSPYGLSEEEMSQMLIDSISHAKEDMKIKALIESRTEAKLLVQSALKFVEQNKDLFHQEELKQLQVFIDQLQLSTEGDEKDKIEIAMQELNDYSKPLAERAMDATIASAMKGKKL